ncbi:MAG: hypothetical protein ACPL7D_11035 [Candidatus Sumerlaeaceae bacterium]
MKTKIAIYDFESCKGALESHAQELAESAEGLSRWASFRDFIQTFAREAYEHRTCVLGQFDPDVVFAFVPAEGMNANDREALWVTVLAHARQLMGNTANLYWIDFLDAVAPSGGPKTGALQNSWIDSTLAEELLLAQRLVIWVFFNVKRFIEKVVQPQLQKRGFEILPDQSDEQSSALRIKHPKRPRTIFYLPWADWFREMVGGGFNMLYLMALVAIYLQKLDHAVTNSGQGEH